MKPTAKPGRLAYDDFHGKRCYSAAERKRWRRTYTKQWRAVAKEALLRERKALDA